VGGSAQEKLRWLQNKRGQWDHGQIMYELCGPNNPNWVEICHYDDVRVTAAALALLATEEILRDDSSAKLYKPFSEPAGLTRIIEFISSGPLCDADLERACVESGRGSKEWSASLVAADSLVKVLASLVNHFPLQPLMPSIFKLLKPQLDELAPLPPVAADCDDGDERAQEARAVDAMNPWHFACPPTTKPLLCAQTKLLHDRFAQLQKRYQVILNNEKARKKAAEQSEAVAMREKADARQNMRQGHRFLNDAQHDRDYLHMSAVPTPEDLLSPNASRLPQNLVVPARKRGDNDVAEEDCIDEASEEQPTIPLNYQYRSVDHYLNTHFLLLSQDCLSEVRRGIAEFRCRVAGSDNVPPEIPTPTAEQVHKAVTLSMKKHDGARFNIYTDVLVKSLENNRQGVGFVVSFQLPGHQRVDWSRSSSRFMNGCLLCLSPDGTFNARTLVVATVLRGVPSDIKAGSTPTITISVDTASFDRFDMHAKYMMIESPIFFEAYRPILKALQDLADCEVPLIDLLLGRSNKVDPPAYLLNLRPPPVGTRGDSPTPPASRHLGWDLSKVFPHYPANAAGARVWNPLAADKRGQRQKMPFFACDPPLDQSQRDAIALALSSKIALIQGPPGCGKTFVGVLIARILLENRHMRNDRPIVFICQTNHALDQILEHVHKYDKNIIRIGGRSESPIMQGLTLQAVQADNPTFVNRTQEEMQNRDKLSTLLKRLKDEIGQAGLQQSATPSIPDGHLARLRSLLALYGKESVISALVEGCDEATLKQSYQHVKTLAEAKVRASKSGRVSVDYALDTFAEWLCQFPEEKIRLAAAYDINMYHDSKRTSLFDAWLNGKAPVHAATLVKSSKAPLSQQRPEQVATKAGGLPAPVLPAQLCDSCCLC
jgi:hypothetical protein